MTWCPALYDFMLVHQITQGMLTTIYQFRADSIAAYGLVCERSVSRSSKPFKIFLTTSSKF